MSALTLELRDTAGIIREGRIFSNQSLLPKGPYTFCEEKTLEYRFVYRNSYNEPVTRDSFKPISNIKNDPLYIYPPSALKYQQAANERIG